MIADAEFGKPIVFKFIEKKNGLFQVTSSFTKNTAKNQRNYSACALIEFLEKTGKCVSLSDDFCIVMMIEG